VTRPSEAEREPSHTLIIRIPLCLDDGASFDYDPVHTALNVVMHVTRLAVDRVLCGLVDVELTRPNQ
jgi:hypothetical protein